MIPDSNVLTEEDPVMIRDLNFVCVFAVGFPVPSCGLARTGLSLICKYLVHKNISHNQIQ